MTVERPTPAGPPKLDPEKLELRARPAPAVRFKKGLIIGIAGSLACIVAAVSWLALDPPSIRIADQPMAAGSTIQPTDALEGAPASYDQVPRLGPPLPGDLGRPILKRQQQAGEEAAVRAADRVREERDRVSEARGSPVMVKLEPRAALHVPGSGSPPAAGKGLAVLHPGTIITASLITGINSDDPGIVLAQVSEAVFDSTTGDKLLIPAGSRMIGDYETGIAHGQRRAFISWMRLVLPDGRSIPLDKLPAADAEGYSGLADKVDFHDGRLAKTVLVSTLLGIGSQLGLGKSDDALARALGNSGREAAARAGDEIVKRDLGIKPSISVRPGWPVRAILREELAIEPWKG